MGVQEQFSEQEWKQVKDLPTDAAMYVATAGKTGVFQMLKESTAAAKAIVAAKDSADALVAAVGEDLSDHDKSDKPVKPEGKLTTDQMHSYLLDQIKAAAALVTQKAPESAAAYGQFIVELAVKVSEAAKEGHHGPLVSDEETAAINDLRAVLLPSAT